MFSSLAGFHHRRQRHNLRFHRVGNRGASALPSLLETSSGGDRPSCGQREARHRTGYQAHALPSSRGEGALPAPPCGAIGHSPLQHGRNEACRLWHPRQDHGDDEPLGHWPRSCALGWRSRIQARKVPQQRHYIDGAWFPLNPVLSWTAAVPGCRPWPGSGPACSRKSSSWIRMEHVQSEAGRDRHAGEAWARDSSKVRSNSYCRSALAPPCLPRRQEWRSKRPLI